MRTFSPGFQFSAHGVRSIRLALTAEGEIYLDRVREILGAIEAA
jgi:hypothetical protein